MYRPSQLRSPGLAESSGPSVSSVRPTVSTKNVQMHLVGLCVPKRALLPTSSVRPIRTARDGGEGRVIRFESVTKTYPDGTVAVDSLSLEAPSGQITVFVGPSGCGKTTSLRMINRMIEPTSGTIWLDDKDTSTIPAHELRRQ